MSKSEKTLGVIAIIALTINLLDLPGSGALTVLILSALSILYGYLSFALFNGIRLRRIFKKESYEGISTLKIVGAILTGFALSITLIGLLFYFLSWPGAQVMLGTGLIGLLITLIVGFIRYQKSKSDYYPRVFKRIAYYGLLGLILILLPRETWLEIRNRNHPEYVNAVKKAWEDPNNQELWDKVEEERRKMNEEK